jgi:hypothetical protein
MTSRLFLSLALVGVLTSSVTAAELRGTITDTTGRPLANAIVLVLTSQRGVVATVETWPASRRSVLIRSPGRRGISAGAITSHRTPSVWRARYNSKPHGPAS